MGVGWGGGWRVGRGGVGRVANFLFVFDLGVELLFCCRVRVVLLSVYFYNEHRIHSQQKEAKSPYHQKACLLDDVY